MLTSSSRHPGVPGSPVWQYADKDSFFSCPALKCKVISNIPPPPPVLVIEGGDLSGTSHFVRDSRGLYTLEVGRQVNGGSVWRHTLKDLFVCRSSVGQYGTQTKAQVGSSKSFLCLPDTGCLHPSSSHACWEYSVPKSMRADDGNNWRSCPELKCRALQEVSNSLFRECGSTSSESSFICKCIFYFVKWFILTFT